MATSEAKMVEADLERTATMESHPKDAVVDSAYKGYDTTGIATGADPVYEKKVAVMNQALIDLGMKSFQWKIYAMTGFGWFVDNVSQGRRNRKSMLRSLN